jgi:opacity protein-like surface antigen
VERKGAKMKSGKGEQVAQNSATATATFADGTVASISGSNTNSGWTAGIGAEYGWIPNWTLKVEWDFVAGQLEPWR